MPGNYTIPTQCPKCGGAMEAGALKTTREHYVIPEGYPFVQLTSGELWYRIGITPQGQLVMLNPPGGPFMVLHYRCVNCGYLEAYAQGKYP
jgi:hypothetical protein